MIQDDPSLYLADFGVPVVAGAVNGLGLPEAPAEVVADGTLVNLDRSVLCLQAQFGGLGYQDPITVDGVAYRVREVVPAGDDVYVRIYLKT